MLQKFLQVILTDFSKQNSFVNLVFCDNNFIHKLNFEFRGINQPTDVLSFLQNDDFPDYPDPNIARELGDVIISVEKAIQQANENHISLEEEIARLAVHGVLHLLGFDHIAENDEIEMNELQENYVEKFLEIYCV